VTAVRSALAPEEATRLVDFARAFKAAARAVVLYPDGHPAIAATLARIVDVTSAASLPSPLTLTVLPDGLLMGDRAPSRPDAAMGELAALLHSHLIGQLTVHGGGDVEAWRRLLLLLGRTPESVRADGGVARAWAMRAGQHVQVREIDYVEALRERPNGNPVEWQRLIASCLQGDARDLDSGAVRELLGVAHDGERLAELMAAVEQGADSSGTAGAKTAALLRMLHGIVDGVSRTDPQRLEPVLRNMASAIGELSPDSLLDLIRHRDEDGAPPVVDAVVSRMSDGTVAAFVARHVASEATSTDRVALAFQTLVRDPAQQQRVIALARQDAAASPLGNTDGFDAFWNGVAEQLMTSYSDEPFVSAAYGRELSRARDCAIDVESVNDDPPERLRSWLSTVSTTMLRTLDLTLVADLLRIEHDDSCWGELMPPVVSLLEDLLLVGDFDAARRLVTVLVEEAEGGRRTHATAAVDALVAGPIVRHVTAHLATSDKDQFEAATAVCVAIGETMVRPLAEALSSEDRPRIRERLTSILLAFGSMARRTVEQLKTSENPAVRRTAIYLIRQFGGSTALPDLTELLDDTDPQVQREALRAILNIGSDEAYQILEQALAAGSSRSRDAIMQSMYGIRDERATRLYAYIVRHLDPRGAIGPTFIRTLESLGALRDPAGVAPLAEVLYKGNWWAPRRTAAIRSAAASAIARIGTPDAVAVLEAAATRGSRGVRAAARAALAGRRERRPLQGAA